MIYFMAPRIPSLRLSLLGTALLSALSLFSQHFYYAPNAIHIPVLSHSQDASVTVGMGRGSGYRALEVQTCYSPMPHIAVMANYFNGGSKDVEKQLVQGGRGQFLEGGAGIYQSVTKSCASLFAGYGQGYFYNYYNQERFSRLVIQRWFVQPGLMHQDQFFRGGVAIRFNYLSYAKGETSFNIEDQELNAIRTIEQRAPLFLPELGLHAGMNFAPFSLNLSLTNIFPKTYNLNFARFNTNLSLTLDIGNVMKNSREKKKKT